MELEKSPDTSEEKKSEVLSIKSTASKIKTTPSSMDIDITDDTPPSEDSPIDMTVKDIACDRQKNSEPSINEPGTSAPPDSTVDLTSSGESFKKPILIIGPRKGKIASKVQTVSSEISQKLADNPTSKVVKIPALQIYGDPHHSKEKLIPLPYSEPPWSGATSQNYSFEVLKSGVIIENILLNTKPFYVFGRLSTCDVQMNHPSASRYHAIVQYRPETENGHEKGFYVYDLDSTHGTYINKLRIKSKMYVPLKVGHVLKIGGSSRMLILQGPEEDAEPESELSVTELKQQKMLAILEKERNRLQQEKEEEVEAERKRLEEEKSGVDWGMGEDADEETDLTENPFASTQNEELYVTDPKKTLRGWFEREGHELVYDVTERGVGQFLCRVVLPVDDALGRSLTAEALVKGKKKEAVVQCAMEACRMLDRQGLLRQATHEGRQRKKRDWADDDFYDSDEDTFLDRTGAVENKRQRRMAAAGKLDTQKAQTYDSLLKQLEEVQASVAETEKSLELSNQKKEQVELSADVDELDAFMSSLQNTDAQQDKTRRRAIKAKLAQLHQEEARLRRLANLARPASLPELLQPASQITPKKTNPLVGARPSSQGRPNLGAIKVEAMPSYTTDQVEEDSDEEEPVEQQPSANKPEDLSMDVSKPQDLSKVSSNVTNKETVVLKPISSGADKEEKVAKNLPQQGTSKVQQPGSSRSERKLGPSIPAELLREFHEGVEQDEEGKTHKKRNRVRPGEQGGKKDATNSNNSLSSNPDYSTWLPPANQSGDGRTSLNDKYGY